MSFGEVLELHSKSNLAFTASTDARPINLTKGSEMLKLLMISLAATAVRDNSRDNTDVVAIANGVITACIVVPLFKEIYGN